jgi:hypothetical protein
MWIRAAPGWVAAALLASAIAAADDSLTLADLARGDQVRLRLTSGGNTVRGTIDATGPDEIVVRPKDPAQPPLRLSSRQMAQLEVVRGRHSHWAEGALIGFVPGAILVGLAAGGAGECDPNCDQTGSFLVGACVGGALTATLGALVGLFVKTDRWVLVEERRAKVALRLAPTRGGFRAGLSLGF